MKNVSGPYHAHRKTVIKSLYKDLDLSGKTVLDFGCGEGNILKDLFAFNITKAYGIDINDELLNYAKQNLNKLSNIELLKGNVDHLKKIESESIDLALALNVIGYFSNSDENLFYKEINRVLRKNGTLIVCHSNQLFDLYTFNRHTVNFFEKYFDTDARKIEALITNPQAPQKISANIRENPLSYKFKMNNFGFVEEKQAFANYHEMPPLLMEERLFIKDINDRVYQDTTNWPDEEKWKLFFQCSMFASRLRLEQKL
ncbi:class I SAM-dependent methyltransferase [Candidatus Berkiella cookevillensis]|uniref:Class I SAM-dependent methyltransferase n=1 Tax=Candidatus Berkiella cookevillensis TaxID=437022 RepID=A0AAE3HPI0_9GAMM|nr:class I SAM-dependent methyltransferase [Candidatus Berkiella cookevillensis]MCS5707678.1 class I SAM-dependent methyltransferase [Candidatus Berkiella cookevillensis]